MSDYDPKKTATENAAEWATPERRELIRRIFSRSPSAKDLMDFIDVELREALDSLEPSAPQNGRARDGFHAGCCVLRAYGSLLQLREKIESAEKA